MLAKAFGINDVSNEYESTLRMMAFRNVALAAAVSVVADDERKRKRFFTIAAAMFTADTVAMTISAVTGRVSPRTAAMLGVTTGALAVVAASGATG